MQGCFDALFVWIPAIVCASVIERMYDWSGIEVRFFLWKRWVSVVIERMYHWSRNKPYRPRTIKVVSVVIERMYDWSLNFHDSRATFATCFSCYWKNVRLKHTRWIRYVRQLEEFQLLLKECTIEASVMPRVLLTTSGVSVVIERMYDWSFKWLLFNRVRIWVSVVIERMYDWSIMSCAHYVCTTGFSCYWKNVRLKLNLDIVEFAVLLFQLLLKECTIEALKTLKSWILTERFSCYWKNVRLKQILHRPTIFWFQVSVVIERMYDWSSETNWLKINDFWQLVSGLFFENGRSAQKVPLFSKIWGDCLTVFDSCGNI